jgi:hypothetical protein
MAGGELIAIAAVHFLFGFGIQIGRALRAENSLCNSRRTERLLDRIVTSGVKYRSKFKYVTKCRRAKVGIQKSR